MKLPVALPQPPSPTLLGIKCVFEFQNESPNDCFQYLLPRPPLGNQLGIRSSCKMKLTGALPQPFSPTPLPQPLLGDQICIRHSFRMKTPPSALPQPTSPTNPGESNFYLIFIQNEAPRRSTPTILPQPSLRIKFGVEFHSK